MIKNLKEEFVGASGSISGIASVLGSWQVCHNVCLGIVAVLAAIGITIIGMPLEFLTELAVPLWTIAFILLSVTILLYVKKRCISNRLILFNTGLVIMGIPFQIFQNFNFVLWTIGGGFLLGSASLYIKDKIKDNKIKDKIKIKKNHECCK